MIAAMAMAAGAAFADTEITSANIVGYNTTTVPGGKWLIAQTGFEGLDANGEIDLQDLISGLATTTVKHKDPNWDKGAAPRVQIQPRGNDGLITGSAPVSYFYIANAALDKKGNLRAPGWANGSGYRLGYKGCEALTNGSNIAAIKLKPGTAFWFNDPADSTISFSGQVVSKDEFSFDVPADKWALICNPFPTAITLNSVKISYNGLVTTVKHKDANWDKGAAPRAQVQPRNPDGTITGSAPVSYFYISNAALDKKGNLRDAGWANGSGYRLGWEGCALTNGSNIASVEIPAGAGFWFQNPGVNCTVTISK